MRRGGSTNPNQPAGPDELYQMGETDVAGELADLTVNFAELEREMVLGNEITLESEIWETPDEYKIPDFKMTNGALDHFEAANLDYYRQFANYEASWRSCQLVRIAVQNVGRVVAKDVRVEMTTPKGKGSVVFEQRLMPRQPDRIRSTVSFRAKNLAADIGKRFPGDVDIAEDNDGYRLVCDFGDIQPGRRIFSEAFSVIKGSSGAVVFEGRVYSNAPEKQFTLTMNFNVAQKTMSLGELMARATEAKETI